MSADPADLEARHNLALKLFQLERFEEAINQELEVGPKDVGVRLWRNHIDHIIPSKKRMRPFPFHAMPLGAPDYQARQSVERGCGQSAAAQDLRDVRTRQRPRKEVAGTDDQPIVPLSRVSS